MCLGHGKDNCSYMKRVFLRECLYLSHLRLHGHELCSIIHFLTMWPAWGKSLHLTSLICKIGLKIKPTSALF